MLDVCPICVSKFISSSEDIVVTRCGHIFHFGCILQWLEKSRSCPKCRSRTNDKHLRKLFFDSPSDESQIDVGSIQNQNDSLQFQITLKNKEIKNSEEKCGKVQKQYNEIKNEYTKLHNEMKTRDILISELKVQVNYLKNNSKQLEAARKRANVAESSLQTLVLVKKVYTENCADIEGIIKDFSSGSNMQENLSNLATISALMQKKLHDASKDKTKYANELTIMKRTVKELEKNISVRNMQNETLQQNLKDTDIENSSLSKKISALQDAIITPSGNVKNKIIKRLLSENVIPEKFKKLKDCDESISDSFLTPEVIRTKPQSSMDKQLQDVEISQNDDSSGKQIKQVSKNQFALPEAKNGNSFYKTNNRCFFERAASSSVVSKSKFHQFHPLQASENFGYDGMGGHHKADKFPEAKLAVKKPKTITIVNRGKHNSTKAVTAKQINDYFKNTFEE